MLLRSDPRRTHLPLQAALFGAEVSSVKICDYKDLAKDVSDSGQLLVQRCGRGNLA